MSRGAGREGATDGRSRAGIDGGEDKLRKKGEDGLEMRGEESWMGRTQRSEGGEELGKLLIDGFCGGRGLREGLGEEVDGFEHGVHEGKGAGELLGVGCCEVFDRGEKGCMADLLG